MELLKVITPLIVATIFIPQARLGQDKTQFPGTIVLQESDYSIIEQYKEQDRNLGIKVKILNPAVDSILSETKSALSLVFQKGEESYLAIGFCIISSFLPPTRCYYYMIDTLWRPIRETDGGIIIMSPFLPPDTQIDDAESPHTGQTIAKLHNDDYVVLCNEKYTKGSYLQIKILDSEISSVLTCNERPVISIQYNNKWITAKPRNLLDPPQGAFYSVDSTGRVMEIFLL